MMTFEDLTSDMMLTCSYTPLVITSESRQNNDVPSEPLTLTFSAKPTFANDNIMESGIY